MFFSPNFPSRMKTSSALSQEGLATSSSGPLTEGKNSDVHHRTSLGDDCFSALWARRTRNYLQMMIWERLG